MSEEFKSLRITLSDEAMGRLETIMKRGSFRSYSSTVEECIRVVYDIMSDVYMVLGTSGSPEKSFTDREAYTAFILIATKMSRITGRGVKKF